MASPAATVAVMLAAESPAAQTMRATVARAGVLELHGAHHSLLQRRALALEVHALVQKRGWRGRAGADGRSGA